MRQSAHHHWDIKPNRALTVLLICGLLLGGCSSSWKAPLDDRARASTNTRAPQQSPPPGPRATRYRVRPGDTLYAIAWRSDKDYRDIARWNGIRRPYTIYTGQWLRLQPPGNSLLPSRQPATRTARAPQQKSSPKVPAKQGGATRPQKKAATTSSGLKESASRPIRQPSGTTSARADLAWGWPAKGVVQSTFKSGDRLRKGIKLAGAAGSEIRAAESGKVVYSGSGLIGYGRLIIVKHNEKYLSAYGHNRKLLVKQGQHVTKGQQIAEMGLSNDGKPLLHFEIRRDGKPVNPMALLPRR